MELKLTRLEARIVEHRLSAETLGDVADDIWRDEVLDAGDQAQAASDVMLQRVTAILKCGGCLQVNSRIEAWCVADCVEGSTWDGQGGFDRAACDRRRMQVMGLRKTLNSSPEFVTMLGRAVQRTADIQDADYSPFDRV